MAMPRRSVFKYGTTQIEFMVPAHAWLPGGMAVGGRAISGAGVAVSYVVRRDGMVDLPLRFWESEQWKIEQLLAWGAQGPLLWWEDADRVTRDPGRTVYLHSPSVTDTWQAAPDSDFPGMMGLTVQLRLASDSFRTPYFGQDILFDYQPGMDLTLVGGHVVRNSPAYQLTADGRFERVAANVLRDSHYVAGKLRTLIEDVDTNYLLQSDVIFASPWSSVGTGSGGINAGISIGDVDLWDVAVDTGTLAQVQDVDLPSGTTRGKLSLVVAPHPSANGAGVVQLIDIDNANTLMFDGTYLLNSDGTITVHANVGSIEAEGPLALGGYRLLCTPAVLVDGNTLRVRIRPCADGVAGSGYVGALNLVPVVGTVPGSFTSYISTTDIYATRQADIVVAPFRGPPGEYSALVLVRRPDYADVAGFGLGGSGQAFRSLFGLRGEDGAPPQWVLGFWTTDGTTRMLAGMWHSTPGVLPNTGLSAADLGAGDELALWGYLQSQAVPAVLEVDPGDGIAEDAATTQAGLYRDWLHVSDPVVYIGSAGGEHVLNGSLSRILIARGPVARAALLAYARRTGS